MPPPDPFLRCYCTGVLRAQVVAALRGGGAGGAQPCRSFDEVRRATGACFGCQSCRPEIEQLMREEQARAVNAQQSTQRFERE